MKMNARKMRELLKEKLNRPEWELTYDREKEQLRVEIKALKKGMTLSIPGVVAKWENHQEAAVDEVVYHIEEALKAMTEVQELTGKEKQVYPVIRSTSFPDQSKAGAKLIFDEHTAETRIYYALDIGNSYRLLDLDFIQKEGWDIERVKEAAKFNVRSLDTTMKQEDVAGNTFYFLNQNDGYDASRILNTALLERLAANMVGDMAVAVPHQDVLIVADIKNDYGYDILGQMAMSFFAEGRVPVTALPFLYKDKELEPIFILAKTKRVDPEK